jgi:hypothetical protein
VGPRLLPLDAKRALLTPVDREAPPYCDATGFDGKCAILGRIRRELVKDQGKRLSSLTIQDDIRSVDSSIAGSGIRRQLATYELRKWDALPTAMPTVHGCWPLILSDR